MTIHDPSLIQPIQVEWYEKHRGFDIATCEETDQFISDYVALSLESPRGESGDDLRRAVFAGMDAWAASLPPVVRDGFDARLLVARYDDKSDAVNYAAKHGLSVHAHETEDRDVYFVCEIA